MKHAHVRMMLALVLALVFASACVPLDDVDNGGRRSRVDAGEAWSDDAAADDGKHAAGSGGSSAGAGSGKDTTRANTSAAGSGGSGGKPNEDRGSAAQAPTTEGSLACPSSMPSNAREASSDATGTIAWAGAVHVTKTFSLRNAGSKLTIAPGTMVFVDPDGLVEVGWNSQQHAIDAQGTETAPIRFCRTQKSDANWRGVFIGQGVSSSSALKHVVIEGAGQGADALVLNAGILLDHVWVRDSASNGVVAHDFRDDSTDLNVTASAAAPLVLTAAPAVQHLPRNGKYIGNKDDVAHLSFDEVTLDTQFREIGIPYQLDKGLSLRATAKLTVDPGVEWRVGIDQLVELGWNSSKVEVHIEGTDAKPIVIRGADARQGSWKGMVVQSGVFATSTLKFLTIEHGGGMDGAGLTLNSPLTASDITLKDNAHEGFLLGLQGLAQGSARFKVMNTKGAAGRVAANALVSVPAGGSYTGNQNDYIEVDHGDIARSGTIPEIDVPFHVLGDVTVRMGAQLVIAPGVQFHMQDGVAWEVGWNSQMATFTAVGTQAKPIVFRGILEQAGYWDGIVIGPNVSRASKLEFVNVGDGGGGKTAGADLRLEAPIDVVNSKLYGSATFGIVADADFPQDYENANTFVANVMGTVHRQ